MFQKNRKIKSNPKVCDLQNSQQYCLTNYLVCNSNYFFIVRIGQSTLMHKVPWPQRFSPLKRGGFKEAFLELFYIKVNVWYAIIHLSLLPSLYKIQKTSVGDQSHSSHSPLPGMSLSLLFYSDILKPTNTQTPLISFGVSSCKLS